MASDPVRLLVLADTPEVASLLARIEADCNLTAVLATTMEACLLCLYREVFSLILLEETIVQASSADLDAVYEAAGGTPVLEVNFALAGQKRVVRQVQAALRRHRLEQQRARSAAVRELRDELGSAVAGLLLQTQLLVGRPGELNREALSEIADRTEALSKLLRDESTHVDDRICIP